MTNSDLGGIIAGLIVIAVIVGFVVVRLKEKKEEKFDKRKW